MAQPMSGIDAKVRRGFAHLDEFDREASAFLAGGAFEIVQRSDPDSGMLVGSFHILREPPIMLSVIAGEAVGQFRSALDHLVERVVRLDHPEVERVPNFPIYPRGEWQPTAGKGVPVKYEPLLRPEHLAIVDKLQVDATEGGPLIPRGPFNRSTLAVIQWFTNVDKHEVPHPLFVSPSRVMFHGHPNVLAYSGTLGPPFVLEEGTELYRVTLADESDTLVPLDFEVELTLGPQPSVRIESETMRAFGVRVQLIVEDFYRATPELWPQAGGI
jgi:hypothetical protein